MPHQSLVRDEALADLAARAQRDIDSGALPSCQFAVARHGELITEVTLGRASPGALYTLFSVTKAYVAAGTWLLLGKGLAPETRVTELIPEFGTNGKEVV